MSDPQLGDLEDFIVANQSPTLQAVQPNFGPTETPPPFVNDTSSESSEGEGEACGRAQGPKRRRHRGRTQPSQCDRVLISYLDPSQPDVATLAGQHALDSASQSEAEQGEEPESGSEEDQMRDPQHHYAATLADAKTRELAVEAIKATQRISALTHPPERVFNGTVDNSSSVKALTNGIHVSMGVTEVESLQPAPNLAPIKRLDVRPPPRLPPISTDAPNLKKERSHEDEETLASSPALAKFTINPLNVDPERRLPAMHMSPSRSRSTGSPDHKQTLPSLTTALNMSESNGTPFSAHSPPLTRPSPGQMSHFGPPSSTYSQPSPHNGMSPPGLPSAPSYWRNNPRDGSTSTLSEYPSVPTSATSTAAISTPASSILTQSPAASYPTPTASIPEQVRQDGQDDSVVSPGSDGQMPNGNGSAHGPFSAHIFKCSVPNCTAAPFQTQYLLNSHMNVHSNTRPHFCNVKGCARGPGGQGFKRKNEMIRHGLVHTSPGYMCPFCPDQQHKYPRPDNLQRHVRVHHMDKDRDDPQLRDVLAQRPQGGNRGRRRRLGS